MCHVNKTISKNTLCSINIILSYYFTVFLFSLYARILTLYGLFVPTNKLWRKYFRTLYVIKLKCSVKTSSMFLCTKFTKWCMASSPPTPPKMYFLSTVQIFDRFRTKIELNWLLQYISLTLNKQTVLYFRANFFFEIFTVYTLITSWIVLRQKLSFKICSCRTQLVP